MLRIDPGNIKALIRRAIANEYVGNLGRCSRDLDAVTVQISEPLFSESSRKEIMAEINSIRFRVQKLIEREACLIDKEGGVPKSLITNDQTLRINFAGPLPSTVEWGHEYTVKICVCNEFGLWSHFWFKNDSDSRPRLKLRLNWLFPASQQPNSEFVDSIACTQEADLNDDGRVF